MVQRVWLLSLLVSFLFRAVICEVENSSENTEHDPGREGKYITPPFGRTPPDSTPCSTEDDTEVIRFGSAEAMFSEEREALKSEISELIQLLRELKKHSFQVPQHSGYFDPASFRPIYQPAHSGETPADRAGFSQMGYPPFYPYPLSLNPCAAGLCGFGPCNQYPCQLNTSQSRPQNQGLLEQILSYSPSITPLPPNSFASSFTSPSALHDPFTSLKHPSTSSFLSRPAETFEEVMVQKHQQNLPSHSSRPFSQTKPEEVTSERYYLPSGLRSDDPVNMYNPKGYRNYHTTPVTKEEASNGYYSSVRNAYSAPSTAIEETPTVYYPSSYKPQKASPQKSPEDTYSSHHPANHRRYYAEDVPVSYYPSAFAGSSSPAVITTEEVSASHYPSRHRTPFSSSHASDESASHMTQNYYPATVTTIEETVVEVPVTYTEAYYPSLNPGRYTSSSGYPSTEHLTNNGHNRAYYSRYPMYQTNG